MPEGILASLRQAWAELNAYVDSLPDRMDRWTSRHRDHTGQEPDWDVERRIAKRRAESEDDDRS